MNSSFPVFRLFGIEVRMHVLFVYMVAFLLFMGAKNGNAVGTAVLLLMLFGLVLLHELGHSLVARRFGIQVIDIVLWPLGGMARMAEIPENSRVEGWVAIAGPLVNLTLGIPALILYLVLFGPDVLQEQDPIGRPLGGPEPFLALFVVVNLMLGIFNLLPAFPMDGGRLLRAWFARKDTWLAATEKAVRVGRYLAWMMILSVFFTDWGPGPPIIGLFILWTGARELWATRMRHARLGGAFTMADLFRMAGQAGGAGPGQAGWPGAGFGPQGPHGGPGSPGGPDTFEPDGTPSGPIVDAEAGTGQGAGGFSDEDIRAMERFHGRLQRPPREDDPA